MTESYLNELNSKLYSEGKIRECQGKSSLLEQTYTSDLWESLKKQGYTMELNKGLCNILDKNNKIMVQEIGVPNTLYQLAKTMR
jgi:hypothetical protein